jgi:conjugal transfer pilus assembly protein TraF
MQHRLIAASLLLLILQPVASVADGAFKLPLCQDQKVSGWSFYCRSEPEDPEAPEEPEAPKETAAEPPKEAFPATEQIMAFRKRVDEVKYRAVLDPTEQNVLAYMEMNKMIAEKAGAFTDQWQRILYKTPHLDANTSYPLASAGVGVYQDQMRKAREATIRNVANEQGLIFVFEDPAVCGICRVQGEVLKAMESLYGISVLGVSRDGGSLETFPNAPVDSGRLKQLGLDSYPSPTLALVNPKTNSVDVIGSGLLTADQVLERVFVISEIPVGERY